MRHDAQATDAGAPRTGSRMTARQTARAVGTVAATVWGLLVAFALLRWASVDAVAAVAAPGPAPFDALLTAVAAAAAWGLLVWLTIGLLVAVAAALGGPSPVLSPLLRVSPPLVRRAAAVLLGLSLVPGTALPAAAAAAGTAPRACAAVADGPVPQPPPHWMPDRPAQPAGASDARAVAPAPSSARHEAEVAQVVVRRGDTLWDLAARHLGVSISARDVALEWPRWYAVNRSTIGADPDLIRPGQLLRAPASRPDAGPRETK